MSLSIIDAVAKNFLHVIYFRKYLLHVFDTPLILVKRICKMYALVIS
jgi:hypothetical protein